MTKQGLYANINARKKKGISRQKSKSTVSSKSYKNMKAGFPKKKTHKMPDGRIMKGAKHNG